MNSVFPGSLQRFLALDPRDKRAGDQKENPTLA
jgi:hypothetical protein